MNHLIEELSKSQTQNSVTKYLEHLLQYSEKTPANLSEDKTNIRLNKICEKFQQSLPFMFWLPAITHKVIANVRIKVDDKFEEGNEEESLEVLEKELTKLASSNSGCAVASSRWDLPLNRNVDEKWIRSLLIDEIREIKADLHTDEGEVLENVRKVFLDKPTTIMFFDSFVNNSKLISQLPNLKGFKVAKSEDQKTSGDQADVGADEKGKPKGKKQQAQSAPQIEKLKEISLMEISKYMPQCDYLIISADCFLENGCILTRSGGLMAALIAKRFKVPTIAIGRGFCLSEKSMVGQHNLLDFENPLRYFQFEQEMAMKVVIGKRYDQIDSGMIERVVSELGECVPAGIYNHYKEYYYY